MEPPSQQFNQHGLYNSRFPQNPFMASLNNLGLNRVPGFCGNVGMLMNYDKYMSRRFPFAFGPQTDHFAPPRMLYEDIPGLHQPRLNPNSVLLRGGLFGCNPALNPVHQPPGTFQRLLALMSSNAARKAAAENKALDERVGQMSPTDLFRYSPHLSTPSPTTEMTGDDTPDRLTRSGANRDDEDRGLDSDQDSLTVTSSHHRVITHGRTNNIASLKSQAQHYELKLRNLTESLREFIR